MNNKPYIKRWHFNVAFWWGLLTLSVIISACIDYNLYPPVTTKTMFVGKTETRIISKFDFSNLSNGDKIKWGLNTYCISSIDSTNLQLNPNSTIDIHLREDGTKCQDQ